MEQDYWSFNFGQKGSFGSDCDSGRQVYDGSIGELIFDWRLEEPSICYPYAPRFKLGKFCLVRG